ncbi:MAG: DedA family protein [Betaproteobacteria bacterium]|nr:DedA family protein [Betaproteobacteria bacterium]
MELLAQFIDIVLHLDKHLTLLVQDYGVWVYGILFVIIFMETGLVVTPFLPGDSLLFVAGAVAAAGGMDLFTLSAVIVTAALCGDNVNYWIGRYLGPRVFQFENSRFFKRENLDRTHAFMERHGPKAIIIARFVPLVRTFVPFVCGVGRMTYLRFLGFSVAGALLWVGLLAPAGYFFGNLDVVKNNLTAVILLIVFLSILPGIIEYLRHRRATA